MDQSINPSNLWFIYVGGDSNPQLVRNFQIGLKNGVWGTKSNKALSNPNLVIHPGDYLVLTCGFHRDKSGPNKNRYSSPEELKRWFIQYNRIALVRVISEVYEDRSRLWTDDIYPYRIKFKLLCYRKGFPLKEIVNTFSERNLNTIRLSMIPPLTVYKLQDEYIDWRLLGENFNEKHSISLDGDQIHLPKSNQRKSNRIDDDLYDEGDIHDLFLQIMDRYPNAKTDRNIRREVQNDISKLTNLLQDSSIVKCRPMIILKYSKGMGSLPNIPWIAFLDTRLTDNPREGVYCVFLFKSNMQGVYLTFSQGVGRNAAQMPRSLRIEEVLANKHRIREMIPEIEQMGFSKKDNINLDDQFGTGNAYEKATIADIYYDRECFPSDSQLLNDLDNFLSLYDRYIEVINSKFGEASKPIESNEDWEELIEPEYTVDQCSQETGFSPEEINNWLNLLKRKKQIIIQGPPGTGKTFIAERLARLLVSGSTGFHDTIQFHPSYTYEDFIQGYFPRIESEKLIFERRPGKFIEFCQRARKSAGSPHVLIIDEINRANLSRVLGELQYLLEYRDRALSLASGGEPFDIPENVFLIGTMNTSDRSIALVDFALRRRFSFIRLIPQYNILRRALEKENFPADSLVQVLKEINLLIDDPNYEIGISFFIKDVSQLNILLPAIWKSEIEPYLEEYFFDQPGKVEPFRWDKLVSSRLSDWGFSR